ncbi:F-box and WD-40 domain protein 7 [Clonorchis sinensis]|uniref:F-box and WD-40 domain protein 7 n=1 Tax=Clonorchis sinensis TaxID=79923 RepID=H2KNY3_CLOSI|nr:F-box and WD-40 domain protein 7 [Clonorchis sinensis]
MKALTFPCVSDSSQSFVSFLSTKLLLGLEPEQILQLVKDLSELLNNQQKENLLEYLTTHMRLSHLESLRLTSRLHSTCIPLSDCYDFVKWLPPELVLRIFSYLPWDALIACSMVNRAWFRAARHPELYRRLCQLPEWCPPLLDKQLFPFSYAVDTEAVPSTGQSSDSIASLLINSRNASVDWFGIFQKRSRLRRNWLLGRHRMRRFTGHNEAVYCVAYDAHRIVSGSADATIRVWNVRTNANWSVQTLRGHSDAVRCLQLLPLDDDSGTSSTSTPSSPDCCSSPTSPTLLSIWQPPEALLISGSADTTIKLWRLSTTVKWSRIACTSTLQGHTDAVRCLQADQQKVLSGSYDCTVRMWDLKTSMLRCTFRGHTAGVICLTYDENLLYSGSLDNTVRVWCLSSEACLFTLYRSVLSSSSTQFWLTPVSSLHLDRLRGRLLIAHHDGIILTWPLPSHSQLVDAYAQAVNGERASFPWQPVAVYLTEHFDTSGVCSGTVVRCIDGDTWHIVCGSDDKTLKVWRADNDQLVNVLQGHEDGITCVLVTSSVLISGSYDKSVLLYDFDIT